MECGMAVCEWGNTRSHGSQANATIHPVLDLARKLVVCRGAMHSPLSITRHCTATLFGAHSSAVQPCAVPPPPVPTRRTPPCQPHLVGEVCGGVPGRDGHSADAVPRPLTRQVARELVEGRLGEAVDGAGAVVCVCGVGVGVLGVFVRVEGGGRQGETCRSRAEACGCEGHVGEEARLHTSAYRSAAQ